MECKSEDDKRWNGTGYSVWRGESTPSDNGHLGEGDEIAQTQPPQHSCTASIHRRGFSASFARRLRNTLYHLYRIPPNNLNVQQFSINEPYITWYCIIPHGHATIGRTPFNSTPFCECNTFGIELLSAMYGLYGSVWCIRNFTQTPKRVWLGFASLSTFLFFLSCSLSIFLIHRAFPACALTQLSQLSRFDKRLKRLRILPTTLDT